VSDHGIPSSVLRHGIPPSIDGIHLAGEKIMHTTSAPQRQSGLPDSLLRGRTPRTSLVDRVAMRVALALLLWSTRPPLSTDDGARALKHRADAERRDREAAWLSLAHNSRRL